MATLSQSPLLETSRPSHGSAPATPPHRPHGPLVPDIRNPAKYTVVARIPIYDVHTRSKRLSNGRVVDEEVDAEQLERICRNTMDGIEQGELPLVIIGHTTDEGMETDQPPVAGFLGDMEVGEYMGRKAIFADLHIKNKWKEAVDEFPYRSVEVLHKLDPSGRISALACLKRIPERPLGTLCLNAADEKPEFYACPTDAVEAYGASDPAPNEEGIKMDEFEDEKMMKLAKIVAGAVTESMIALFDRMSEEMVDTMPPEGDTGMEGEMPPEEGMEGEMPPEVGEEGMPPGMEADMEEEEEEDMADQEEGAAGEERAAEEENEVSAMAQYRKAGVDIEISRYAQKLAASDRELLRAKERIRSLEARNVRSDRAVALTALKVDYEFDLPRMVERCAMMSQPDFERQVEDIRTNFRAATPIDEDPLVTADRGGNAASGRPGRAGGMTPDDFPKLQRFAKEKGLVERGMAIDLVTAYLDHKKQQTA